MAYAKRTDPKGQTLKVGEAYRKTDNRYSYSWTDSCGRRKVKYAKDLLTLRKIEKKLMQDLADGIDPGEADRITVNQIWNKYINSKENLRPHTRTNYIFTYDRYVRDTFGKMKLSKVRYTHVKEYYLSLMKDKHLAIATIDNINTELHPAFQLAVRDGLIRINPTEGVMNEIKRNNAGWKGKRDALTVIQQKNLVDFIDGHPIYDGWYPVIVTMLGTGMRVGETIGLRWEDVDFTNRIISVNHNLTYGMIGKECGYQIGPPKTLAGIRTIPLIQEVYDAMLREYEMQKCTGFNQEEIDGYSGFLFTNAEGGVLKPHSINTAIKRIIADYNSTETKKAKVEKRDPELLPDFSCHSLRHTFCTRLCESESNIKVIQSIMGHSDIQTTLDIYADCTDEKKQEVLQSLDGKIIIR